VPRREEHGPEPLEHAAMVLAVRGSGGRSRHSRRRVLLVVKCFASFFC
jgi:hypothetical protein